MNNRITEDFMKLMRKHAKKVTPEVLMKSVIKAICFWTIEDYGK